MSVLLHDCAQLSLVDVNAPITVEAHNQILSSPNEIPKVHCATQRVVPVPEKFSRGVKKLADEREPHLEKDSPRGVEPDEVTREAGVQRPEGGELLRGRPDDGDEARVRVEPRQHGREVNQVRLGHESPPLPARVQNFLHRSLVDPDVVLLKPLRLLAPARGVKPRVGVRVGHKRHLSHVRRGRHHHVVLFLLEHPHRVPLPQLGGVHVVLLCESLEQREHVRVQRALPEAPRQLGKQNGREKKLDEHRRHKALLVRENGSVQTRAPGPWSCEYEDRALNLDASEAWVQHIIDRPQQLLHQRLCKRNARHEHLLAGRRPRKWSCVHEDVI
mmetsp:Transcript_3291/g.11835  ORF Transcript_3291/g.11835 Transcript_3291/m.11835 type:complete len:330 (-) Transcript_3291:150-1139(-)